MSEPARFDKNATGGTQSSFDDEITPATCLGQKMVTARSGAVQKEVTVSAGTRRSRN